MKLRENQSAEDYLNHFKKQTDSGKYQEGTKVRFLGISSNIFEALQSRHQAKLIDPILATASLMPAIL